MCHIWGKGSERIFGVGVGAKGACERGVVGSQHGTGVEKVHILAQRATVSPGIDPGYVRLSQSEKIIMYNEWVYC
jgi:hypothetical protein